MTLKQTSMLGSCAFLAAVSLVGPGLRDLTRGVFRIGSAAGLVLALVLFAESALRLWRLRKDGRAPASLLAALVKPVYDRTVGNIPGTSRNGPRR